MWDTTHLLALQDRLFNERARLAAAKTSAERERRSVWVSQCEKELEDYYKFLGLSIEDLPPMTTDELLEALRE